MCCVLQENRGTEYHKKTQKEDEEEKRQKKHLYRGQKKKTHTNFETLKEYNTH